MSVPVAVLANVYAVAGSVVTVYIPAPGAGDAWTFTTSKYLTILDNELFSSFAGTTDVIVLQIKVSKKARKDDNIFLDGKQYSTSTGAIIGIPFHQVWNIVC
jgi:hypothetical protein